MKRILIAFSILLFVATAFAGPLQNAHKSVIGVVRGDTYSDIILFYTMETNGSPYWGASDYSGGDTTPSLESATISTDAAMTGTYGLDADGTWHQLHFTNGDPEDIFKGAEGRLGFKLKINTWVNNAILFKIASNLSLFIANNEELTFRYNDGTNDRFATSTEANMVEDVEYFVEVLWDSSSNTTKVLLDGDQVATNTNTFNSVDTAGETITFGIASALAADLYIDNIMISSDSTRNLYLLSDFTSSPR